MNRLASETVVTMSVDEGVATLTLSSPSALNTFTPRLGADIAEALDVCDADEGIRVVVLRSHGKAFCAGADLRDGSAIFAHDEDEEFSMERHADSAGLLTRRFLSSTKPLVTAYNGAAVGVGLTATLATDIRVASARARFSVPFLRLGLVPEGSSTWLLPHIIGMGRAMEWVLTGRLVDATEALSAGLVSEVVEPHELDRRVHEIARAIADHDAPVATAITRRAMWRLLEHGDAAIAHEIDSRSMWELGGSRDVAEGVAAFLERRTPEFPLRVPSDLPTVYHAMRAASTHGADQGIGQTTPTREGNG